MEVILEPWPWYVAGPLIALTMFLLLFVGKKFGMSSNMRTACAAMGAGRASEFFKFDWKSDRWNLMVALGAAIGGFIAAHFLSEKSVDINPKIAAQLAADYQIYDAGAAYLPAALFSSDAALEPYNFAILLIGGLLVGFGARYAGGCTSGHAISGLSNLQVPSLIAVIGFFIGGLIMIHVLFPFIF